MIRKILISLYIGFFVYCLISLISGPVGYKNLTTLDYFKTNLQEHVNQLQIKGEKLHDEINRLSTDKERITIAARPLGYVEKDEKMIKILNNSVSKSLYDIDPQFVMPTFKNNTNFILLISSLFSVVSLVLFLFIDLIKRTFEK